MQNSKSNITRIRRAVADLGGDTQQQDKAVEWAFTTKGVVTITGKHVSIIDNVREVLDNLLYCGVCSTRKFRDEIAADRYQRSVRGGNGYLYTCSECVAAEEAQAAPEVVYMQLNARTMIAYDARPQALMLNDLDTEPLRIPDLAVITEPVPSFVTPPKQEDSNRVVEFARLDQVGPTEHEVTVQRLVIRDGIPVKKVVLATMSIFEKDVVHDRAVAEIVLALGYRAVEAYEVHGHRHFKLVPKRVLT